MTAKPLTAAFSIAMHIIQLIVLAVGAVIVFEELKGDVRVIDDKLTGVSQDVEKITKYLGIWEPKQTRK